MTRLPLLLLGFSIAAAAQSADSPPLIPISGRVFNAATGDPIAGAAVHYRGSGNTLDQNNHALSPPTLQGEVTTGRDGSYTTPPLPAFGDFTVRASAPGFFAAKDYLQALPARLRKPPPLPAGVQLPPGYNPLPHDGTLRLQPDAIDLRPMSDAALAAFAMPLRGFSNREYLSGAFSADAGHLQFTTLESTSDAKSITRRCRAWTYDLATGVLTGTDRPGSPYVASMQNPDMPPNFCPGGESPRTQTTDRRFSISENYDDAVGRSACGKLVFTAATNRTLAIAPDCPGFSFRLDAARDLVFYTQAAQTQYPEQVEKMVEFSLATGDRRAFSVPIMNQEPELLAEQALPSGATRIAYTIDGDCDAGASDYSQPGQPDGVLGNTPNQFSVCFVTLPAEGRAPK